ncbi:3,4-dihydroxyphenylacetate 2,3-dioxygenase, partial [Acinetobacter baumannii]
QGCRQAAIDGHKEIGQRCRDLDVDTIVVFDSHWLVNSAFHINCGEHFKGIYTSNELPHFIKDMEFEYDGNPVLGQLMQEEIAKTGVRVQAHNIKSLELEYGTLVPMRYMNQDRRFKVVSVSAFCTSHSLQDSRKFGEGLIKAIERYDGNVAIFASGSLSHRFIWDWEAQRGMDTYTREWDRQVDKHVVKMWENAEWAEFCAMLPEYAEYCFGEGGMHDTAMLLGALGWDKYNQPAEIITPAFPSSGTGQINAIFPLMPNT